MNRQFQTSVVLLFVALLVLAFLLFIPTKATRDLPEICDTGVLRVASCHKDETCCHGGGDTLCFHYAAAQRLTDSLGVKLQWHETSIRNARKLLRRGKIDLIACGSPISANSCHPILCDFIVIRTVDNVSSRTYSDIPDTLYLSENTPQDVVRHIREEHHLPFTTIKKNISQDSLISLQTTNPRFSAIVIETAIPQKNDIRIRPIMKTWEVSPNATLLKEYINSFITQWKATKDYQDLRLLYLE